MKFGELSNTLAPAIGMRFERVIKTEEGKLNRSAKAYIQHVIGSLEVNVYIIGTTNERKMMSFLYKFGVPYTRVIHAESLLEIPDICIENELITYYDLDMDILQNVRARGSKRVEAKQWMSVAVL